ncbi:MAG: MFS transporter [Sideroxydans sp.]|jgi:MFS family permease
MIWKNENYHQLWVSTLILGFAGQISGLALSLLAANKLQATPTQIGILGAMGTIPFALFLLPAGVWLDRTQKLPAYVYSELLMIAILACIPVAWFYDRLTIEMLFAVSFVSASVSVVSGTAGQVVVSRIVRLEQLVEAHGKIRVAGSFSEILGPGLAGVMIKFIGAPLVLVANCFLMLMGVLTLRKLQLIEPVSNHHEKAFWPQLKEGIDFVIKDRLLLSMGLTVGSWQILQTCVMTTQVLFATRELGLNEFEYGLCLGGAGVGTVLAGMFGHWLADRFGHGPTIIVGIALSGIGWAQLAWAPSGSTGIASYIVMLVCFSSSVVLIFSNMLALRQAVTPHSMLARMTSTMRWLTLFPAIPGALLGGVLAEHFGLRFPLIVGGLAAIAQAAWLWKFSMLHSIKELERQT